MHLSIFSKQQILDSSKLKEFADNNFKFAKNGRKFLRRVENTVGKGEMACYEKYLEFGQVQIFSCSTELKNDTWIHNWHTCECILIHVLLS